MEISPVILSLIVISSITSVLPSSSSLLYLVTFSWSECLVSGLRHMASPTQAVHCVQNNLNEWQLHVLLLHIFITASHQQLITSMRAGGLLVPLQCSDKLLSIISDINLGWSLLICCLPEHDLIMSSLEVGQISICRRKSLETCKFPSRRFGI